MNEKNWRSRPEFHALAAAALNGMIGPFNRAGFMEGGSHHQIAFFKCFAAFLILLIFCSSQKNSDQNSYPCGHQPRNS
ncbi:hypothetical protein [Haematospirillum sp. H1815]|uniref:hypothetical protein n=1 Tax=Haematospirillum sp. H1815 TaxID=2723108 RepID=UPI001ADE82B1|nr:hypothetical protein [Haematospirillum sp. H1815]